MMYKQIHQISKRQRVT